MSQNNARNKHMGQNMTRLADTKTDKKWKGHYRDHQKCRKHWHVALIISRSLAEKQVRRTRETSPI